MSSIPTSRPIAILIQGDKQIFVLFARIFRSGEIARPISHLPSRAERGRDSKKETSKRKRRRDDRDGGSRLSRIISTYTRIRISSLFAERYIEVHIQGDAINNARNQCIDTENHIPSNPLAAGHVSPFIFVLSPSATLKLCFSYATV